MKKILFIFGTRPEAIKLAPLIKELQHRSAAFDVRVCVTAQHRLLLDQVLQFFNIKPDYDLGIMEPRQSLSSLTSKILEKLESPISNYQPDLILVQGDTTSAFVGALAAFYKQVEVGHIEAGLRSGDIYSPFPEEMNRALIGKIASYHFAPTRRAMNSLLLEGVSKKRIHLVGNTVVDALLLAQKIIYSNTYTTNNTSLRHIAGEKIVLVTGHRRESFGKEFENMCRAIKHLALTVKGVEIFYPVHLNPNVQEPVNRILGDTKNIHLLSPLSYPDLIWLMERSYLILTDSGGIQEEAPALGKPVLVMRKVTERKEGIEAGVAKLVGTSEDKIYEEALNLINNTKLYRKMANAVNPYGDGTTALQIANILELK